MPKLNIPPKQDYVSDITADEINKIVSAINELIDDVTEIKNVQNDKIIDGGSI